MLGVFALAASLLMLDKMLRLFDFVATEGGPVTIVFKMLVNLIPEYARLAIPLGLMLGILFAFRKLATTSELDVMRAVGLSYTRLLRVPYLMTFALMAVNFAIVGYWQPLARYGYEQLDFELRSGALGASIKVGEFTQLEDRMALRIEQSDDDGRQLMGIFARIANDKGQVLSISAREGRFLANRDNRNTIILRLTDGTIVQDMPGADPARADLLAARPADRPAARSSVSARAATRAASTSCPSCSSSAGATRTRRRSSAGEARRLQLPHGRSGDDAAAAAARGGAGDPAQALDLGARGVRLDRDGGRLSQGQPIRAGGRRARPGRPVARAVGAVRAVRRADRVDVLARRLRARRAGDRRARGVSPSWRKRIKRAAPPARPHARRSGPRRRRPLLLDFFPSRTLTRYLAKMFATRILAVLVMLVLVLMMLDLLGRERQDPRRSRATARRELLHYVSLRMPQLIARFLPYSVLLATIITLATFNQNSEVIAMKAAGPVGAPGSRAAAADRGGHRGAPASPSTNGS